MRLRAPAMVAGSLLIATATAQAVVPRSTSSGAPMQAETLTALPAAKTAKPLRTYTDLRWAQVPSAAWSVLETRLGGRWRAAYDRATGVPSRIWGSGFAVPGANASPVIAETYARMLLADHLALLAPGARASDFVLVSNHSDGEIRSIGFVQQYEGRRVVGGQVSFRFKRDRLIAIGSEALPDVEVVVSKNRMSRANVRSKAEGSLRSAVALSAAPISDAGDEVILPLIADDSVQGYRLARPMTIDGGAAGRYLAYADAATGEVLAVQQLNLYATGTLRYKSVSRHPGNSRVDLPAPNAHVMVSGSPAKTAADGSVTWSPDAAQTLTTAVIGDFVEVVNQAAGGMIAFADLPIAPGGNVVWDASANIEDDAQVQVYLSTNIVKDYVRTYLDPNLPTLNDSMTANVNIAQDCNAFFDGKTINFFHKSTKCQNTGLLQDVVYHEYGHALHTLSVIEGVGKFDGAMSEGASDFLAALITNDPGMGRGFFFTNEPLRSLDPIVEERRWPEDVQEIHHTGLIYGGTMWDLRKALIAELGEPAGIALTNKLYMGTLRRATNIPSSLIEALVEDDDDGNLDNGTPHECTIRKAFGRHGLRTATGVIAAPATLAEPAASTLVRVELTGLSDRCEGDNIFSVTVDWKPASGETPAANAMTATKADRDTYYAEVPLAPDGTIMYRARVQFDDQSILTLADNLADPYYQLYQGKTIPLYCTSFETGDPLQMGWTTGSTKDASPWAWGPPMGGSTDPHVAFSGEHILAQELGGNYKGDRTSFVEMPAIDVGRWSDVRLQYRRWLAVEDSHFDKARIKVNGKEVWINATQNIGDGSSLAHVDREWRFHDVSLSGKVPTNILTIRWELSADTGLAFGGWQLDDVCVVANVNSVCGDGVKTVTEACDDGQANADKAGACRTYCQLPACGDQILDEGEDCDAGPDGSGSCTDSCARIEIPSLGGCCSTGGGVGGSLALGAIVGGLLVIPWRRRRRR
ncbi:MAG: M36 family metallopeptidase [Deltaproteobacteria bacterium]|nr:M36 family metallopeptidase [Deltaproteobacteria bacterium]